METNRIALQLYTVRDMTEHDFAGTLFRVAEIGYTAVEFAGYGGLSSNEMKALLKETGLRAASTHVGLDAIEKQLDREIAYCQEIGCSFMVLPWLAPALHTAEHFRLMVPLLNEAGRRCKEHGITFAYHNHDFEFVQVEGQFLLDIFLEATDPTLVQLELDGYWAAYAGVDVASFLRKHSGRVPLFHLKDMTRERTFTEVGDGVLGLEALIPVANEGGTQWYIVENDRPQIPSLESASRSLQNIRLFQ